VVLTNLKRDSIDVRSANIPGGNMIEGVNDETVTCKREKY
jgi:hypothetical protein